MGPRLTSQCQPHWGVVATHHSDCLCAAHVQSCSREGGKEGTHVTLGGLMCLAQAANLLSSAGAWSCQSTLHGGWLMCCPHLGQKAAAVSALGSSCPAQLHPRCCHDYPSGCSLARRLSQLAINHGIDPASTQAAEWLRQEHQLSLPKQAWSRQTWLVPVQAASAWPPSYLPDCSCALKGCMQHLLD